MDPLDRLVRRVACTIGDGPGPRRRARQRRAAAGLRVRAVDRRGWWALAVATACVLVLAWIARSPPAPTIARVAAPSPAAGAWLVARERPVPVEFADHSRVVLAPGAAVRVVEFGPAQAELKIEGGAIEVTIAAGGRAWQVTAGPFTVRIAGAQLRVEWQPDGATLTVEVLSGDVLIGGGSSTGVGTRLSAGQRLVTTPGAADPVPGPVAAPAAVTPPRREPGWRELSGRGDHAAAIAAAERVGLGPLLDRLDAAELERLAHSARMARAAGPARDILQALRRRFPGDPRAATATFLLGRVALELANDPVRAAEWFGEYVHSQPRGPLAADARARRMQLLRDLGDPAGARAAADEYLHYHPDGARAGLARTILERP